MFKSNNWKRSAYFALTLAWAGLTTVAPAVAQFNLTTYQTAQKDDWEEINFEYNQSVLTDGFPSLLRLAELLNQNPGYRVKLEGHGDQIGPDNYNDALGQRRADSVKTFLVKYGTRAAQLDAIGAPLTQSIVIVIGTNLVAMAFQFHPVARILVQ